MRSGAEVLDRLRGQVASMCARPGMWSTTGAGMQVLAGTLLSDLCFIDEREEPAGFDNSRKYGKLGVVGPFAKTFGEHGRYVDEVASVFAEQFHVAGYLDVERSLTATDHAELVATAADRFEEVDLRRSEIEALIGSASYIVGGRIACYAPADRQAGWVFLDYWTERIETYDAGKGVGRVEVLHEADPLLRDVRLPTATWTDGLILTLLGKYLRWGPGWWLDHRTRAPDPHLVGIAEQLRSIRQSDPSQALNANDQA